MSSSATYAVAATTVAARSPESARPGEAAQALIVPCDPLNPRRAEPHFADELDAARAAGWTVGLIDHDSVVAGRAGAALARVGRHDGPLLYRGWMIDAVAYAQLADALAGRGLRLRVSPERYRAAHELPGWVDLAVGLTADTVWAPGLELSVLDALAFRLGSGPAVLRDFVKSAKHHWDEAVFVPDVADRGTLHRVGSRFVELRGDDLTGGFVLRRFENHVGAEVRTWWWRGRLVLTGPHPDSTELPVDVVVPERLPQIIDRLGSPFVAADLVRRADGRWRLVEIGDGQVSDRPATLGADTFIAALD